LGLAATAALAITAGAQADQQIGLTYSSSGIYVDGGSGQSASEAGGVVTLTNAGNGSGFAYAIYTLDTPVPVSWINGLTADYKVLSASSDYTANPLFIIDADSSGGINPGTDVPAWFYTHTAADLGNTGPNTGDSFISSDANINADGVIGQGPTTYTLIGTPPEKIEGWYGSAADQVNFDSYLPWRNTTPANDSIVDSLNSGGYGGTQANDMVYQLMFILGGSPSFANSSVEISNPTLSIPEPASLGLLAAGGLLMLKRRRATRI
jgi:hypothetical protein